MREEPESTEPSPPLAGEHRSQLDELGPGEERVIQLREEQLLANKQLRELGEVIVRTEIDTVPAQLEVEALGEGVEVVHEPVGQAVATRDQPHQEDDVLIVPVYEEQLVVTKRLVLRERLRVRRVSTTERQLFQDSVRRERLVVEDPHHTRLVHEIYPTDVAQPSDGPDEREDEQEEVAADEHVEGGLLTKLVTKALE